MSSTYYNNNTHLFSVEGLKNPETDEFVNDATVIATILSYADEIEAGPYTLDYVTASEGTYKVTIPHDALDGVTEAKVKFVAEKENLHFEVEEILVFKTRRKCTS